MIQDVVLVSMLFDRMQGDGTMDFFLSKISRERSISVLEGERSGQESDS